MFGAGGAVIITVAALISVYGWVASNMLNVPRLTMAMAERGALPSFFAKIHPTYRTPWVSILIFAAISLALALQAGLLQNLSLSAVSRLLLYGGVCASLPVFRSREARGISTPGVEPALFRVKGGPILAAIGVALSLLLATRMNRSDGIKLGSPFSSRRYTGGICREADGRLGTGVTKRCAGEVACGSRG
jgi:APA family basic amino acid/polyamine antiporter